MCMRTISIESEDEVCFSGINTPMEVSAADFGFNDQYFFTTEARKPTVEHKSGYWLIERSWQEENGKCHSEAFELNTGEWAELIFNL